MSVIFFTKSRKANPKINKNNNKMKWNEKKNSFWCGRIFKDFCLLSNRL